MKNIMAGAVLSEKGQVTIPKSIRNQFGLTPGVRLEFRSQDGVLVISKSVLEDPLEKWRGKARKSFNKATTDEYLKQVRDADSD